MFFFILNFIDKKMIFLIIDRQNFSILKKNVTYQYKFNFYLNNDCNQSKYIFC